MNTMNNPPHTKFRDPSRPRWEDRDVPYRPPREKFGYANPFRLVKTFFFRYLWPHKWPLFAYLAISTASLCSVYLMSFYGQIVIDKILVVDPPALIADWRARASPTSILRSLLSSM